MWNFIKRDCQRTMADLQAAGALVHRAAARVSQALHGITPRGYPRRDRCIVTASFTYKMIREPGITPRKLERPSREVPPPVLYEECDDDDEDEEDF